MKSLLLITSIFCLTFSYSQNLEFVFSDTVNTGHQINISSFNFYASNSFNNNLTKLINNKTSRDLFSKNGPSNVKEKFSYNRLVSDMKMLYNKLLSDVK